MSLPPLCRLLIGWSASLPQFPTHIEALVLFCVGNRHRTKEWWIWPRQKWKLVKLVVFFVAVVMWTHLHHFPLWDLNARKIFQERKAKERTVKMKTLRFRIFCFHNKYAVMSERDHFLCHALWGCPFSSITAADLMSVTFIGSFYLVILLVVLNNLPN